MPQRVAKKTLFLNADRTAFVDEGDPEARFLFVREGSAINEAELARLEKAGVKTSGVAGDDLPEFDARAAHEAQYGAPNAQREAELKALRAAPEDKSRKMSTASSKAAAAETPAKE